MKKFALKFEKAFLQRMVNEGLEKVNNNCCRLRTEDCVIHLTFGMFYNPRSMEFNSGGEVLVYSTKIDEFFKDYKGKDVFRFYYTEKAYGIYLIFAPMLWYLSFHHGKEKYPGNMYKYFDKSTIIDNVTIAVDYFYNELYQKVFLPIKENYGTIALADKNINSEILRTGKIKEANIVWADHDFHCMRSLLFAYMNGNPKLPELLEICNAEMDKSRIEKPESERIKIYEYIVQLISKKL